MKPATRFMLASMVTNLVLAALCIAIFWWLPFGPIANAVCAGLLWIVGGFFLDRRHLARLSPQDRAEEFERRKDADL